MHNVIVKECPECHAKLIADNISVCPECGAKLIQKETHKEKILKKKTCH